MSPVAVLVTAALGALLGLLVPVLIARLPEPAPQLDAERDQGLIDERAALPSFELWGLRPDDGTKEAYADLARLRAVRLGSVLASGLVGGVLGARYGFAPVLLGLLPLVPVGVALAVIDWRTRLLPTRIVLPATLAVVVLGAVAVPVYDASAAFVRALVGLVVARSVLWLMWRFLGTGFGDVRLAALVGFVLAYQGWSQWLLGLWAGFVLFSVPGLLLATAKRDRRFLKVGFPFGPFMLLGLLTGLVWGPAIMADLVFGGA